MSDFIRINKPRADKMAATLALIEKSGKSTRALPAQYEEVLGPVLDAIEELTQGRAERPAVQSPITATSQPVMNEQVKLQGMSTQQLVDIMIAAGAILQHRRK